MLPPPPSPPPPTPHLGRRFRPLKGRLNVILTRNPPADENASGVANGAATLAPRAGATAAGPEGVLYCTSLNEALTLLASEQLAPRVETVFVIGGAQVGAPCGAAVCCAMHFMVIEGEEAFEPPSHPRPLPLAWFDPCENPVARARRCTRRRWRASCVPPSTSRPSRQTLHMTPPSRPLSPSASASGPPRPQRQIRPAVRATGACTCGRVCE